MFWRADGVILATVRLNFPHRLTNCSGLGAPAAGGVSFLVVEVTEEVEVVISLHGENVKEKNV